MTMTLPASQARQSFARTILTARSEPVGITQHGNPEPVVMIIERDLYLRAMEALEDAEDAAEGERILAEVKAGTPIVPLQEILDDLGITDA